MSLDHKVAILIPTKKGNGNSIPTELWTQWIKPVKTTFANLFGGYTSLQATGGFVTSNGMLIEEDVTVVFSYCTGQQLHEGWSVIHELAHTLKRNLAQECVAIVIDGRMEFAK